MNRYFGYVTVILFATLLASINFFDGFSQDFDGYLLLHKAKLFVEKNHVVQSRTWGFPMYENIAYRLYLYFGILGVKVAAFFFYLLSGVIFYRIVEMLNPKNSISNCIFSLAFVSSPFMVISGNSFMETSQGVFFALLAVYYFVKSRKNEGLFWLSILSIAIASATRPDYVILAFAFFASKVISTKRLDLTTILQGITYWVIFIFPFFFYTDYSMPLNLVNQSPFQIKIIKIILSYLSLFGIMFYLVFFLFYKKIFVNLFEKNNPLIFILPIAFFLYTIRLWLIPDEVEYILILLPLILIALSYRNTSLVLALLVWGFTLIPNFFQVHLFSRNMVGEINTDIGFSKGAILQDKSFRLQNEYIENDLKGELIDLSKKIDDGEFVFEASKEKNTNVLLPSQDLRMYFKGREHPDYYNNFSSQKIYIYPFPSHKGWKQFIKFEEFLPIEIDRLFFVESIEPLQIKKVKL